MSHMGSVDPTNDWRRQSDAVQNVNAVGNGYQGDMVTKLTWLYESLRLCPDILAFVNAAVIVTDNGRFDGRSASQHARLSHMYRVQGTHTSTCTC